MAICSLTLPVLRSPQERRLEAVFLSKASKCLKGFVIDPSHLHPSFTASSKPTNLVQKILNLNRFLGRNTRSATTMGAHGRKCWKSGHEEGYLDSQDHNPHRRGECLIRCATSLALPSNGWDFENTVTGLRNSALLAYLEGNASSWRKHWRTMEMLTICHSSTAS